MLGSALMTAVSLRFTSPRHPLRPRHDPGQRGMPSSTHPWSRRSLAAVTLLAIVTTRGGSRILAGAPPAEAKKRIVNIAAKEPDTLDPHSSTLGQTQAIARFMFRGLARFAIKDGKVTTAEVEPDLAESWTLSPDGTVWTFQLRKGVQFHKGFGELTAEDVKFSLERQINQMPGTRFGVNLEIIKSIEVVTPHTVQIALKSFDPIFLLRMVGYQNGYIVSKKAVEKPAISSSGTRSARAPSTSTGTRPGRRSSSRSSTSSPAAGRRSTRSTGSTCPRTPPS